MLTCGLCAKTFNIRHLFQSHIATHTNEKPHKCLTCSATFARPASLTAHIKNVHGGIKIKNFQCPECSYKCSDTGRLNYHLRKHSAELPFSCTAPSCSFKTKHRGCLSRHVRGVHIRDLSYACKSDGCVFKTSEKYNLHRHLKTHSNERPFECNVPGCSYTGKTKEDLKVHTNGVHNDKKPWKCATCDFRTNNKSYLKKHQAAHSGKKHYPCKAPNCRYACNTKMDLILHFDRKHRKKEILCTEPGCKYRCGSTTILKKHLKDHKRPFMKCPVGSCAYSTKLKSNLRFHYSCYHGDQQGVSLLELKKLNSDSAGPPALVETRYCPFTNCDYRTDFVHRYDRHIVTYHKGEQRKYSCKFCSSRFALSRTLENQIQRHVGEKPYSCSHCGYTASGGWDLRHHAQRVHHVFVIPRGEEHQYDRKCRTCNLTCSSYSEFMLHSMTHLKPVVVLERLRVHVM